MRVRVLYFGVLKERFGAAEEPFELPDGATVGELVRVLRERSSNPAMGTGLESVAVAVNREYSTADVVLDDGDEVALLPPVSGGCSAQGGTLASLARDRVAIVDEAIDTAEVVRAVKAGSDGAVCVFDGIVRDNTRGRKTLHLDYEAYREMALAQMQKLAEEAVAKFGVRDVAMVHRLGRLEVGETSVLIVVASAHRAAAFEACRWLIDTLKKTVPIWKRETFVDGAVWADGEPFPDEIGLAQGSMHSRSGGAE
ncbi:MAG TPA: molybdopterin converting factor subunit 1 [Acidobacteriaceae bacterium]|nr:molybdopterin converting factor subunit 1 [Acidobacteriaceae bacterium]